MPVARLNFRRHFVLLACALAVIVILARLDIFGASSLLPNAAIYGALHAIALSGALKLPATRGRKSLFILMAAALDVAALYIGILVLALFSTVPLGLNVRAYIAIAVGSMAGAICYGLLIRFFWMPELTPRPIVRISAGCLTATLLTLLVENLSGLVALWAVAAVWWCAFSTGLWVFGRTYPLRTHADA
jgi:hypothetical protein